jgi:large subunit ribosomal protein L31
VKAGIHPDYQEIDVRCACGATWKSYSTKKDLLLDICNNCHPFYTGRQKLIDTEGRVERFTKRFGVQTAEGRKAQAAANKAAKSKKSGATA